MQQYNEPDFASRRLDLGVGKRKGGEIRERREVRVKKVSKEEGGERGRKGEQEGKEEKWRKGRVVPAVISKIWRL